MDYADEDEVDWSDGTLTSPSPKPIEITTDPSHLDRYADVEKNYQSLFVADYYGEHNIPCGLPLDPAPPRAGSARPGLTRVQRARTGVRLNRRIPSKEDYSNFVLYQASQKAYEVTFLRNFVAHALHHDRISQCTDDELGARQTLGEYLKAVTHEVNEITKKMVWNAHCRAVHLLARDGKDGAPFFDVHSFDTSPFSGYGPGNLFHVAEKVNTSWHYTSSDPPMVRYSTREYNAVHGMDPLEDVDAIVNTLFRKDNFGRTLPTGRAVKLSTSKKRRGQHQSGAAAREDRVVAGRGNWLDFASVYGEAEYPGLPMARRAHPDVVTESDVSGVSREPFIPLAWSNQQDMTPQILSRPGHQQNTLEISRVPLTQLQDVSEHCASDTLKPRRVDSPLQNNGAEPTAKEHFWRMMHNRKRRLGDRWETPLHELPHGRTEVLSVAQAMGLRPTERGSQTKVQTIETEEQEQMFPPYHQPTDDTSRVADLMMDMFEPEPDSLSLAAYGAQSPTLALKEYTANTGIKKRTDNATTKEKIDAGAIFGERPKKKSKKKAFSSKQSTILSNKNPVKPVFAKLHPSGSRTLELHQELPPTASFERTSLDEKPAWRCGMKHAMGHYYNAGDRKSCRGCNTNVNDGHNNIVFMDFYLPTRSFFYQPAPNIRWKPNKPSSKPRKSSSVCHNGIAKDAYWGAMNSGATEEEAIQRGVKAVVDFLAPKPPPKMPTQEPGPEPEPEPDLGPHISGSASMEHGQEIPDGYYWEKQHRHEELAWRCDVNHALGRYYLAGDKKSCPGCGSNKGGQGKHEVMDFYLPPGVTVRQEAPGLSKWKPRKPYNVSKPTEKKGRTIVTHNQMCSKAYFQFVAGGHKEDEALRLAIEQIDTELSKREEDKEKAEDENEHPNANVSSRAQSDLLNDSSAYPNQANTSASNLHRRTSRDAHIMSLVPKKRSIDDLEEGEIDEREICQPSRVIPYVSTPRHQPEVSSSDEETSGSDSE